MSKVFEFKNFSLQHSFQGHKIGTDSLLLGAWIGSAPDFKTGFDFGTGSGVLMAMLASVNQHMELLGIEKNKESANEAILNMQNLPFRNQIQVKCLDIVDFQPVQKADFVVMNPPYFNQRLDLGIDARLQARLGANLPFWFEKAYDTTTQQGHLFCCLPKEQFVNWQVELVAAGWYLLKQTAVSHFFGQEPFFYLLQLTKECNHNTQKTCQFLKDENNQYSKWVKELLFSFVLSKYFD